MVRLQFHIDINDEMYSVNNNTSLLRIHCHSYQHINNDETRL